MAETRLSADLDLVRILVARASVDPAFREALGRVITADPNYQDYVERKRNEGAQQWLSEDEWETWVFGKDPDEDTPEIPQEPSKAPDPRRKRKERVSRLFTRKEIQSLPKWAAQKTSDPDKLFEEAKEAYPKMLDWLDRGEGIDKLIGAHVVRRDRDPEARVHLDKKGPLMVIGAPKTKKSAEEKVNKRYGGDWKEGAVDLVRASIAVDNYDEMKSLVSKLKDSGMELASKPRNRFRYPTHSGYRDTVLSVRMPNGHVMELQLHLKPLLQTKEQVHPMYQAIKGLDDKVRYEGRDSLSEEELALFDRNVAQMKEAYDKAWEQSKVAPTPPSIFDDPEEATKTAASDVRYYDMDGLPVFWERPRLPQIYKGKTKYPVDSMAAFAERATQVSPQEFKILFESRRGTKSKDS